MAQLADVFVEFSFIMVKRLGAADHVRFVVMIRGACIGNCHRGRFLRYRFVMMSEFICIPPLIRWLFALASRSGDDWVVPELVWSLTLVWGWSAVSLWGDFSGSLVDVLMVLPLHVVLVASTRDCEFIFQFVQKPAGLLMDVPARCAADPAAMGVLAESGRRFEPSSDSRRRVVPWPYPRALVYEGLLTDVRAVRGSFGGWSEC